YASPRHRGVGVSLAVNIRSSSERIPPWGFRWRKWQEIVVYGIGGTRIVDRPRIYCRWGAEYDVRSRQHPGKGLGRRNHAGGAVYQAYCQKSCVGNGNCGVTDVQAEITGTRSS